MKYLYYMKYLLILLLFSNFIYAQPNINYSGYTNVWVKRKNPNSKSWIPNEVFSIKKKSAFNKCDKNDLTILIPDSNKVFNKVNDGYILCYLINNTLDTFLIDRCDATIFPAETQILVNGIWQKFQISRGSSCGNSYFKSRLPPKSYYTIWIHRPTEGNNPTLFRLKLNLNNKAYYSNPCSLMLPIEAIQNAGQSIKH